MSRVPAMFFEKALLFLVVLAPLAQAEGEWWYLAGSVLAVGVGWWRLRHNRKPLLGPVASRVLVVAAFGLLVFEYVWLTFIHVVALSHFMIVVCASKFLQQQTLRDDAQLLVLCLLLLVVAAIVSGNVIFLVVLLVYLTIGLDLLVRFHLLLEGARAERANLGIQVIDGGGTGGRHIPRGGGDGRFRLDGPDSVRVPPASGIVLTFAPFALLFGVGVFAFCPRVGAGMFGRPEVRRGGATVTGLSDQITFNTIGPVTESERPIMRVQVDADGQPVSGTDMTLYLRGRVFDLYANRGRRRGWEWQRFERSQTRGFDREETGASEFNFLPEYDPPLNELLLNQHYTIEQGALNDPILCSLYPPVAIGRISSDELEAIEKTVDDQCLRARHPVHRLLRYTIQSPATLTPSVVRALQAERNRLGSGPPRAHPPDPPLPRENEIRERIAPLLQAAGPLDVPENRMKFAQGIVDWLQSPRFAYTLSPPPARPGVEPIGDFLLRHRSGYCKHFASAMVIMCQLAGAPARLVSGYRCDSYNYNTTGRFWSVRAKHAHAWVEVYIPGRDWVRFDPTPEGAGRQAALDSWLTRLRNYGEYIQFQWGNLVLAYDADLRRNLLSRFGEWIMRPARNQSTVLGMVAAFVYELFAWRMQMSWRDRLLYWVFALLIVALVVLIGYVVVVLSWRGVRWLGQFIHSRRADLHRMGDAVLYHRLCRRLSALGLRRRPDQTPAEFAAEVAARHPVLQPATEVVSAYYGVVYGAHSLSPQRRQAFEQFLRKLSDLDRAALDAP